MGEAQAPRTVDAAERAQLIRVAVYFGPPCLIMVNALAFFLHEKGMISGGAQAVLAVLSVPIAIAGVVAIHVGTSRSAAGFAHVVSGAGNIPPPPSYPRSTQGEEAARRLRDLKAEDTTSAPPRSPR